jgi:uncharacterized protein
MTAASKGHTAIVQVLLENGAEPDARDSGRQTALMMAAVCGHISTVHALLSKGVDVNAKIDAGGESGWTALMEAAYHGHTDVVRALPASSADVNARDISPALPVSALPASSA